MALFNFRFGNKPDLETIAKNLQMALQKQTPYQMSSDEMFPGEQPIQGLQTITPGISPEKAQALAGLTASLSPQVAAAGGGAMAKLLQAAFPQLAGQGEYKNVQVDDLGQAWGINPNTNQFEKIPTQQGFSKYKTIQGVDASGAPIIELANIAALQGGQPGGRIKVGEKGFSDAQNQAANYGSRMVKATQTMDKVVGQGGFDPANIQDAIARRVPLAGNYLQSSQAKQYRQAQEDWVRAKLRKESGAVIGPQEMQDEITTYFPQPGDDAATIQQKAIARWTATQGMVTQSSGSFAKNYGNLTDYFTKYDPAKRFQQGGWSIRPK